MIIDAEFLKSNSTFFFPLPSTYSQYITGVSLSMSSQMPTSRRPWLAPVSFLQRSHPLNFYLCMNFLPESRQTTFNLPVFIQGLRQRRTGILQPALCSPVFHSCPYTLTSIPEPLSFCTAFAVICTVSPYGRFWTVNYSTVLSITMLLELFSSRNVRHCPLLPFPLSYGRIPLYWYCLFGQAFGWKGR